MRNLVTLFAHVLARPLWEVFVRKLSSPPWLLALPGRNRAHNPHTGAAATRFYKGSKRVLLRGKSVTRLSKFPLATRPLPTDRILSASSQTSVWQVSMTWRNPPITDCQESSRTEGRTQLRRGITLQFFEVWSMSVVSLQIAVASAARAEVAFLESILSSSQSARSKPL